MAIPAQSQVGPRIVQDGSENIIRSARSGELVVTDAHGKYQEAVTRGGVFTAANTATQALSLGSATATGLILTNPAGSGKNLVVLEISSYISAAITAVANVAVFANINSVAAAVTQTTPITPRNALLGTGTSAVGLVASAATLPAAPTLIRSLFGWHWVTAGTPAVQLGTKDLVDGAIVLSPGTAISIQGVTAAHSAISSITWEEIAI